MANEIHVDYTSGNTLYAVVRNTAGKVWYAGGQVFESWGTGSRAADDYDISLTDKSGNRYVGSFDSNIPAGRYSIQIFLQAGVNPADSDNLVGGGEIIWSGVGEVTSDKLLANKAVQNWRNQILRQRRANGPFNSYPYRCGSDYHKDTELIKMVNVKEI
jgi:hypothetical protein